MPAPLVVSVETAHEDQAERNAQTNRLALPGPGVGQDERRHVLRRAGSLLRRVPKTDSSHYDSLFTGPEVVEDDYYRFRHQPRG